MFDPKVSKAELGAFIAKMPDVDFARFMYCQHIASTYLAVSQFEDSLIEAMLLCDRVKLQRVLGQDMPKWQQLLEKRRHLNGSTVGTLIGILARHEVSPDDIAYLRWVKDKRDYFIHRLFQEGAWPGDLSVDGSRAMTRRLQAIQLIMGRAQDRIWKIFKRAGFVDLIQTGDGFLAMNLGLFDDIEDGNTST